MGWGVKTKTISILSDKEKSVIVSPKSERTNVSTPSPPVKVSTPKPPSILSLPIPPIKVLAFASPNNVWLELLEALSSKSSSGGIKSS